MLGQSTLNFKSRILDCFDFLQKSRNDGVEGIVIAICFAFYAVIARFDNVESWQSKQNIKIKSALSANLRLYSVIARALPETIQKIKSFCFVLLLQNEESPYPTDPNPQSEISPICSWLIYFTHCFKSRDLDTSLHCVPLSMTKLCLDCHALTSSSLAMTNLCAIRRHCEKIRRIFVAIHFGDSRIVKDSLTLGESKNSFGLLRRIYDSPRNDKLKQSTPHTTLKGIKMQT